MYNIMIDKVWDDTMFVLLDINDLTIDKKGKSWPHLGWAKWFYRTEHNILGWKKSTLITTSDGNPAPFFSVYKHYVTFRFYMVQIDCMFSGSCNLAKVTIWQMSKLSPQRFHHPPPSVNTGAITSLPLDPQWGDTLHHFLTIKKCIPGPLLPMLSPPKNGPKWHSCGWMGTPWRQQH